MKQFDMEHIRLSTEDFINNDFHLSVSKNTVKKDYRLHWHDFFEIELILEGSGEQRLNGTRYSLQKGVIYLLKSTDFHEVKVEEDIVLINIMFNENLISPALLSHFLNSKQNDIFQLDEGEFQKFHMLCEQLLFEFREKEPYKKEFIRNLLECIFISILRKQPDETGLATEDFESAIKKALLYLHGHFRENPSLREVADKMGLNQNYFCEIFHRETGQTFKKYLSGLKLNYAKNLLLSSDLSVTEICYASGYVTLSHFLREFKNMFGRTALTFRKQK